VLTPYPQAQRSDEDLATVELLRLVEGHHLQMSKRRLSLLCAAAGPCCTFHTSTGIVEQASQSMRLRNQQ